MKNTDDRNILLLIGVLALAILPHVSRLPLWISAWCFSLWGYAFLAERYVWYRPNRIIRLFLTLAGVMAGLRTFGYAVGLDAGVGILSILLGLKILEVRSHRDMMVTLFLGYFMIITTLFYSGSLLMTLYMFVAVLLSTTVLIHINHPASALEGNLGLSSVIMVQALPIMIVLFFLFPRIQGSLFALPQKTAARTGFSDRLTPGSISSLVRSSEIAFRAEFKNSIPNPDRLYWRGIVFWHFNGESWDRGLEVPRWDAPPAGKNVVEYTLTLEPHGVKWLFAMDLPVSVPDLAVLKADHTLVANSALKERIRYTVKSGTVQSSGNLRQWETAALELPEKGNPKAAALARDWASMAGTPENVVETALEFFRNNGFVYTLNPPLLGQDSVDEFLFRYRRGYCEHYASAFVFLMRSAGIPSRIVGGYLGGEVNPYGDYLIVRQSDAHAWAEVWLPSKGWTRVDPTSAVAPERVEQGMTAALSPEDIDQFFLSDRFGPLYTYWKKIGFGWDALNTSWNRWVLGYSYVRQKALLSRFGIDIESWKGPITVILVAVILIVLFIVLYYFWTNRKPAEKKESVQKYYDVFCEKLEKIGLPRKPEQGPLDYARRVVSHRQDLNENVREITALYISMRYGRGKNEETLKNFTTRVKNFNPK
jgi:transglutaminase-like putative cysteine protease